MTSPDPLAEFAAENRGYPARCSVRKVLGELDPERATRLQAALAAAPEVIQHAAIARTLAKWGATLRPDPIRRHRTGQCACDRG